jgi:hypothetical protein
MPESVTLPHLDDLLKNSASRFPASAGWMTLNIYIVIAYNLMLFGRDFFWYQKCNIIVCILAVLATVLISYYESE